MTGIDDALARVQQIQLRMATLPTPQIPAGSSPAFASALASAMAPPAVVPAAATTADDPTSTTASTTTASTTSPWRASASATRLVGADALAPAGGASPAGRARPASGAALANAAQRYLGIPYVWGGTDPATGLDCSGLVQRVAADNGIAVPRTSEEQVRSGTPVGGLADARPGDLVFFGGNGYDGSPSSPGHVGIYIGNGQMIDAPHTGADVRVDPVGNPVAIRRLTTAGDAVAASPAATASLAAWRPATLGVSQYTDAFATAAASTGVPAALLASVARTESSLDPNAVSPAGALGLMQLMPGTAAGLGVDPMNPTQAISGAARMLAGEYARFGSWPLALAAYNAGPGAVQAAGGIPDYPETQAYVQKVLAGAGMAGGAA